MADWIELALPCRLVSLQVSMAPEDGLSTLENLVARAVLLRHDSVESLAELFCLGERLVSDVVTTMWEKGFLVVDLESGRLDLSESARSSLTDEGALTSSTQVEVQEYVIEPVTGSVRWEQDREVGHNAVHGSLKVPFHGDISAEDIPEEELIRAVQAALNRQRAEGIRRHVLRVGFGNRLLRPPNRVRWLHIKAAISQDAQSRRYSVRIADDWGPDARQRLTAHLQQLIDDDPGSEFVEELGKHAAVELSRPLPLDTLLTNLSERIAALPSTEVSQAALKHNELTSSVRQVEGRLDQLERAYADVVLVNKMEGQDWVLRQLIAACRHQLVISAPEILYRRLNPLLKDLRSALDDNKVRLVVLWGRAMNEKLPTDVDAALRSDLGRRFPGQVLVAPTSCQTDACVVIQDDEQALVTSYSVLGDVTAVDRTGIVLGGADDVDGPAQAVVELLVRCRQIFPDLDGRGRIAVNGEEFGRPVASGPVRARVFKDLPDPPSADVDEAELRLWANSWAWTLRQLLDRREQLLKRTAARVLADGENREALWEMIRTAQRRLVVADDRFDPAVADPALVTAVVEAQARSAAVQLIYPRLGANNNQDPFRKLAHGRERILVRSGRAEARLVLSDGSTLIGSFSPLADGDGRLRHRSQRRSQLGVLVDSEETATEAAALLRAVPAALPPASLPSPALPVDGPGAVERLLLEEVRQAADGREIAERVRLRLANSDHCWAVLRNWVQAGVPSRVLRPAVAAALKDGRPGGRDRDDCTVWLIADAWERRAFVEGALVAPLLSAERVTLARAAQVAGALEVGPLGPFLSDLVLEAADSAGPDDPSVIVTAVAAIAESLLWTNPDGSEAAELLKAELPEAWRAFVEVVVDRHSVVEGQFPLALALHEQARLSLLTKLETERAHILELVTKIERVRVRFRFPAGQVLYQELFARDGLLTRVKAAASADLSAVVALRPDLPDDVLGYLDRVVKLADVDDPMIWSSQLGWLRNIEDIVSTCRRVGAHALDQSDVRRINELPPGQAAIARHLAEHWDSLFSEADGLGSPWRQPLLALMDRLEPVVDWARAQG